MALREILAFFSTQVDTKNLDLGLAKVDAFAGRVASIVERPFNITLPVDQEIEAAKLKFTELEQAIQDKQLTVLVGGDTAGAQAELLELQAEAFRVQDSMQGLGEKIGTGAEMRLTELTSKLKALGDVKTADPKALRAIEVEAKLVEAQLKRLSEVDASNASLPKLKAQLAGVRSGLAPVEPAATKTGGAIASLAGAARSFLPALGTAALVGYAGHVVGLAGDLADLSVKMRMSVEEVQAWQMVARGAGADTGALEGGARALGNAMADAAKAGSEQEKAFAALGVSTKTASGVTRTISDVMIDVGAALNGVTDEATQMDLSNKLLGKSSQALLPIFKDGSEAARAQLEQFRENAAISQEFAEQSDELGDQMMVVKGEVMGAAAGFLKFLIPGLKFGLEGFRGLIRIVTPARVGLASITAGFVAWPMIAARIGSVVSGLGGMGGILGRLGGMLGRVAVFAARFVLPFLVLDDILVWLQGGDSLLGRWLEKLGGLGTSAAVLNDVRNMWEGLTGAIQICWNVLSGADVMANVSASQAKGLQEMSELWAGFSKMMGDVWSGVKNDAAFALTWIGDQLANLLAKIPLIGEDMAAAIRPVRDAEGKLPGEGKGVFDQDGFTGGGAGFTREAKFQMTDNVQAPAAAALPFQMFPDATVPAPPPALPPTITNSPTVQVTFNGVAGTPAELNTAAGRVVGAVEGKLQASNQAVARAAGVPI